MIEYILAGLFFGGLTIGAYIVLVDFVLARRKREES